MLNVLLSPTVFVFPSWVSIVTTLWTGESRFSSQRSQRFFSSQPQDQLCGQPSFLFNEVPSALFPGIKLRGHKITTHLNSVLRLRNCGAILPFPHMSPWCGAWLTTGTTLLLYSFLCNTGQRPPPSNATVNKAVEQSPAWEANGHSASQIPHLLWNLKLQYYVHRTVDESSAHLHNLSL
jgi:hypothetical protein